MEKKYYLCKQLCTYCKGKRRKTITHYYIIDEKV